MKPQGYDRKLGAENPQLIIIIQITVKPSMTRNLTLRVTRLTRNSRFFPIKHVHTYTLFISFFFLISKTYPSLGQHNSQFNHLPVVPLLVSPFIVLNNHPVEIPLVIPTGESKIIAQACVPCYRLSSPRFKERACSFWRMIPKSWIQLTMLF